MFLKTPMADRHAVRQRKQFRKISEDYQRVHGHVLSSIYRFLQKHYYGRLKGKTVLDIGNGGQSPEIILGREVAATVKEFVGIDNSPDMLNAAKSGYTRIVANGLHLPFKDKSFDYVLINAVFHHLGSFAKEDQQARIQCFLREVIRVCRHGALVYEIFLPPFLEKLERGAVKVLRYMPTFVLSEGTLDRAVSGAGFSREEIRSSSLSALTHPFYKYIVIMDYKWLKLPAFISPFQHTFFTIPARKED